MPKGQPKISTYCSFWCCRERLVFRLPLQCLTAIQHFCSRFRTPSILVHRYLFHRNCNTVNIRGGTNSRLTGELPSSLSGFQEASTFFYVTHDISMYEKKFFYTCLLVIICKPILNCSIQMRCYS